MSLTPLQVTVISAEHLDDLPAGPIVSRTLLQDTDDRSISISKLEEIDWTTLAGTRNWRDEFMNQLETAAVDGRVNYVVPGHPLLGDATMHHLLLEDGAGRVDLELYDEPLPFVLTEVLASISSPPAFVDSLTLRDLAAAAPYSAGMWPGSSSQSVIVTNVITADHGTELLRLLMRRYRTDTMVRLIPMMGDPVQLETTIGELAQGYDSQRCYLVLPSATGDEFQKSPEDLQRMVARLRAPNGCPWDRDQTNLTLTRNLVEESYELLDAIESGDFNSMREELGDFILQAWLHCQIIEESGAFTLEDVVETLISKLVRRHPHVFAEARADDADSVVKTWDEIKRSERGDGADGARFRPLGNVPQSLPALARAQTLVKRAGRNGFDLAEVSRHIQAAVESLESTGEKQIVGQLIDMITTAQENGVDLELSLRSWTRAFETSIESGAAADVPRS